MKMAVIYNSQTGFTTKYAQWISEETGADCFELDVARKQNFDDYDAIVFGGRACAGTITKVSWFKSHMDQWVKQEKVHLFYCPGGLCWEKMSAGSKLMMKMFIGQKVH